MSRDFFEFFCPVKIVAGYKALEHIPFELDVRGASRPMIVTDPGVTGAGIVDIVNRAMSEGGRQVAAVFDQVSPDSPIEQVVTAAHAYRDADCDSLIAIGGGSVMDTAKAVNVLVTEGGDDLTRFIGVNNLTRPLKPLFAIPTTAGTGSEVTSVSVIKDTKRGAKVPLVSQYLMPDVAVIDPRMTLKLPPVITAATGMDALTHAIEAFVCLGKNPMSDAYATAAITRVGRWLIPVLDEPSNTEGRLELAQAATMAGIAFSNSMVGLVHSLGHALGAAAGIHHGTCMSIFLPHVLRYNLESRKEQIGELLIYLTDADTFASTPIDDRATRVIEHITGLRDRIYERCGLPRTLSETGKVSREDLSRIRDLALDDGSLLMNPVEAGADDMDSLLDSAW
jgi:alcohol dehydrogenase